jgi:hypothetical protein
VEGTVYLLCALTALACAVLLLRGFARSRTRLLLWCGIFFAALAIENSILFVDRIIGPSVDLTDIWGGVALLGMGLLLFGLIWDRK